VRHSIRFQPYPQTLDKAGKDLPGTNTLAYYNDSQLMAMKRFITLATAQQNW